MLYFGCGKHAVNAVPCDKQNVDHCPVCSEWWCESCRTVLTASEVIQGGDWNYLVILGQRYNGDVRSLPAYHVVKQNLSDRDGCGTRHYVVRRRSLLMVSWPPVWLGWNAR